MTGRSDDLLVDAIGWLEADAAVQDGLGEDGAIYPIQLAQGAYDDDAVNDAVNDADPRIFVAASVLESSRDELWAPTTLRLRVIVDGTRAFVESAGMKALITLKSDVIETLTRQRGGYDTDGVASDAEIAWSDSIGRYLGAVELTYNRQKIHQTHG